MSETAKTPLKNTNGSRQMTQFKPFICEPNGMQSILAFYLKDYYHELKRTPKLQKQKLTKKNSRCQSNQNHRHFFGGQQ